MSESPSVEPPEKLPGAEPQPGSTRLLFSLKLPSGSRLELSLNSPPVALTPSPSSQPIPRSGIMQGMLNAGSPGVLLALAMAVYLLVRLVGLADWPIYFFTDEAVQTVMAADFIEAGLKNYDQEFLPTFFSNGPSFNLSSVTVYIQVLPYLLFGKSVYATRLTSMLISALGALFVTLILKHIFKSSRPWLGILLLSSAPAWFLHSRTAFETVEMSAFFAGFLYCYLRYRQDQPRYLYGAVAFGALVFYTYGPGQLIIAVAGLLLFLVDLPYHWQQRRWVRRGFLLLLALALPYLRYQLAHSESALKQLAQRAPYWVESIPLAEKLDRYFSEYQGAFSPLYWFVPNQMDLDRHLMKGYGHLFLLTLPLALIGLFLALRRIRQPAYRVLLVALLVAPTGSALVQIGITRLLCMVIPLVLLMALGVEWCLERLQSLAEKLSLWPAWAAPLISITLFAGLSWLNFGMLSDALRNGPLWYKDYTLSGMQYGARQLFPAAAEYLAGHPGTRLLISPSWTNGTGEVKRFFVPDELPISLGSVHGHMFKRLPLDDYLVFVMLPYEYQQVLTSGKFTDIQVEQTLPYPDGNPGFYFVRMRYVDNVDAIFEAERLQRRQLQEIYMVVHGEPAQVKYSMLDIGIIEQLFDDNENTLTRTLEANPYVIDLAFEQPRPLAGLRLYVGSSYVKVTANLELEEGSAAEFSITKHGSVPDPRVDLDFDRLYSVRHLHLEVKDLSQDEPGNVHVWEITFKQQESP